MRSLHAQPDGASLESVINGLMVVELHPVIDRRGSLMTLFVGDDGDTPLVQWNLVRTVPGVIRGIHVHSGYDEYYAPFGERTFIHLHDARRASPSFGRSSSFWVDDAAPVAIRVPAGVAHGLAFPAGGLLLYGLSARWSGADEFACRWDDEHLAVPWPIEHPMLSDRDASAGSYADMMRALDDAIAAAS